MNELALFAGAGGGILGSRLLGWRTICAVESNAYCREVLIRRQDEGHLRPFPIWDDARTFDGRPWNGLVDVVSAGFPCQPFSNATHGHATATDLWDEVVRIVEEVRPRAIICENVLAKAFPFEARPYLDCIPASALGAPHARRRCWLAAYADDEDERTRPFYVEMAGAPQAAPLPWWQTSPESLLGMGDGVAYRVERDRAVGNGQVPAVVRAAWKLLAG